MSAKLNSHMSNSIAWAQCRGCQPEGGTLPEKSMAVMVPATTRRIGRVLRRRRGRGRWES